MRNYIATLLILLGGGAACGGCQAPGAGIEDPHSLVERWHPATELEMRQVIGETVMQAMHQYQKWMIQQTRKKPRDNMPNHFPEKPIT